MATARNGTLTKPVGWDWLRRKPGTGHRRPMFSNSKCCWRLNSANWVSNSEQGLVSDSEEANGVRDGKLSAIGGVGHYRDPIVGGHAPRALDDERWRAASPAQAHVCSGPVDVQSEALCGCQLHRVISYCVDSIIRTEHQSIDSGCAERGGGISACRVAKDNSSRTRIKLPTNGWLRAGITHEPLQADRDPNRDCLIGTGAGSWCAG